MKRFIIRIIIILLCLIISHLAKAQRRLPGQIGLQLTAGWGDGYPFIKNSNTAFFGGIALSSYTVKSNKWMGGLEYFQKNYCYKGRAVPLVQITTEGGYYQRLINNRGRDIFLNLGGSALIGYETSNWGVKHFPDGAALENKDGLIGGGAFTLELEAFVADRVIILFSLRERILFGSSTGQFHTQAGIGIKYIIK